MAYLIDSDWIIDWLAGERTARELLVSLAEEGIGISIVTYMEAYQGVSRSQTPVEARQKLADLLEGIPLIPFSPAVARRCAGLRETLRKQGRRVNKRALDLLIAATAIEHDLELVTRNTADYADVPELKLRR